MSKKIWTILAFVILIASFAIGFAFGFLSKTGGFFEYDWWFFGFTLLSLSGLFILLYLMLKWINE